MTPPDFLEALANRLDAALPQTQCTRCGYPDCSSYAQAIAQDQADINRCPPGGAEGILRLAQITGRAALPLDGSRGEEGPRTLAVIDEAWCIGCTLCIKVCPVDAILGASKLMHSVINDHCTGCELCLPVCPVDCIALVNVTPGRTGWNAWTEQQAAESRSRYQWHLERTSRDKAEHDERMAERAQHKLDNLPSETRLTEPAALTAKRAVIEAALARARAKRQPATPANETTRSDEA